MDRFCFVCDKTIKTISKRKHLPSLTDNEPEKVIQIEHTIENPNFFDIEDLFNEHITNHIKKPESILVS